MSWTPTLMQKFVTICPGVSFSGVKQAKHLEQATDQEMRCREILFTPRRSPRAREFPRSCQLFCTTYGCGATGYQNCPIFRFWPIFPIQNAKNVPSGDQPAAHGLHRRMIPIFLCRRSKKVPSGISCNFWYGSWGPPNLPKFSPMANGYIHTECNCTAHQIWTKDV